MINPTDLAQFRAAKARGEVPTIPEPQAPTPPEGCALSIQRANRLKPAEWKRAWSNSLELVTEIVTEAMSRDDGTEIGAQLVDRVLDLLAFGLTEFAGSSADPRRAIRTKADVVLASLWNSTREAIAAGVDLYRQEIHEQTQAQVAQEREQMTHAADEAQAEATRLRRELDTLRAQQAQVQAAHAAEIQRLRDNATRERDAYAARERTLNEERRVLIHDRDAAQQLAARLNRELDTLTTPAPLEVTPMPAPIPLTALQRASLCVYARTALNRRQLTQADLSSVPDSVRAAWQAAYPTHTDQVRHLRAALAPQLQAVLAA